MSLSAEDKELLELAARAIGSRLITVKMNMPGNQEAEVGFCLDGNNTIQGFWNPLESNEDAFSLAIALFIWIQFCEHEPGDGYTSAEVYGSMFEASEDYSDHESDAEAATRRAIVRCAAGIGKTLPPIEDKPITSIDLSSMVM